MRRILSHGWDTHTASSPYPRSPTKDSCVILNEAPFSGVKDLQLLYISVPTPTLVVPSNISAAPAPTRP